MPGNTILLSDSRTAATQVANLSGDTVAVAWCGAHGALALEGVELLQANSSETMAAKRISPLHARDSR